MALYTPPDNSDSSSNDSKSYGKDNNDISDDTKKLEKFYSRPSLGLRLWGPLVPASDNQNGLWTLITIQTGIGLFFLYRYRALGKHYSKSIIRDIADVPSLNRFSTTHGQIPLTNNISPVNKVSTPNSKLASNTIFKGKTPLFGISSFSKRENPKDTSSSGVGEPRKSNWNGNDNFKYSSKFIIFKRILYGLTGAIILSQSLLETCRLKILKYDPWLEEAKCVREKKFFNDIIKYYNEGIDPTKVKVKDSMSGNPVSTNIPEVKQSVALVRAQNEAENPIIKWFGPIEYKPMSFTEYLDRLEYHLDMFDFFQKKRAANALLWNSITHTTNDLEEIIRKNEAARKKICKKFEKNKPSAHQKHLQDLLPDPPLTLLPPTPSADGEAASSQMLPPTLNRNSIVLDQSLQHSKEIDLKEFWRLHDPWMNLGLETSLSIKFIPTVMKEKGLRADDSKLETTELDKLKELNNDNIK
ncbi:Mgr1p NDAI_0A00300 [Naumovozyma dairenensis CBS 421]|uniref:Mitochondrial inner membrane i-AAA protease complex subunit MGR1 n=1 Tax=Naumovozyma dairenensis (strain ATCC 10597 / BCRC 20456 / CBS 421 / NBRC 0211 / NRRL Y-12639) TaxID=1071378 RepID=G0W5H6_NAUDC|nr:hypothetical protein NDAI_0A00300 [Naumovozyma dairenensis CBS 421]CCD22190.1 hypothetical protein NDAI_0A00300 [Naumovozyma dairenensis CBS 421]